MQPCYFIGIDVGTGSARAGLFDASGALLATAKRDIALWQDGPGIAEQSSDDIWGSVCAAVREAVANAGVAPETIAGIGIDATCSLVVLGDGGRPLAVGPHGDDRRNIIVWMDHRATDQARRINATGHKVLDYVGGTISPEMETPKLLWLKEELPQAYRGAWQFLDLADFLTWRATGSLARSICTVTCKWTYLAHESRWDAGYFRQIGLSDLADHDFDRVGTEIVPAGQALGAGLTQAAAAELDLRPGTAVGAGLIDAHAGGIGSVGAVARSTMAYVLGTSACTMASSTEPIFIPGVWGPYFSAMVPGLWLNEGGQSSAGAAIEQAIALHPAASEARALAQSRGISLPDLLAGMAADRMKPGQTAVDIAGALIVVPDFLGNRSPFADPEARALIAGLGMERDLDSLVALYVAALLGIGYGLRQIVEASRARGASIETIALSGGAGRHALVQQLLADCTGVAVSVSRQSEPVLLGAAMLGATAAGKFADLPSAMAAMTGKADIFRPSDETATAHQRRFEAFATLQQTARSLRNITTRGDQHGRPAA
ncbi:FGGY-family carbohydrate kinase [Mesorhizobium sp. Z1-4]|uniref:FGGY-family carbohydrate kinase n=1 Tax=Mesorhizobium sp. Z1-4 TaxID=2448478 RepID=UPI000FD86559|nr:FGGY-family carbohydrate kinase [Mesorhizobium sp. Z1-4]